MAINSSIVKHNNSILRLMIKEINEGIYNDKWIKIKIDEDGYISGIKKEEDIKYKGFTKRKKPTKNYDLNDKNY